LVVVAIGVGLRTLEAFGSALAAAILTWIGWIAIAVRPALALLSSARQRQADIIQRERTRLEQDRAALVKKREQMQRDADSQQQDIRKAEEANLRPDQRMEGFIRERRTRYLEQLGIISKAHKDFRDLSAFLAKVGAASTPEGQLLPPIDRIVLYIDDLDRCPENKVFDVLQAVHLLLAFELFVVVVAVDSRWLLHSVTKSSATFQAADNGGSAWTTTPLDYLEKIFQIPYTLQPMARDGYERLVEKLTATQGLIRKEGNGEKPPEKKDAGEQQARTPASGPGIHLAAAGKALPVVTIDPNPEHLVFEPHEIAFTEALYPLMSSPRNTKRFVNVYRLIRASLGPALETFKHENGAYQPAQVLIAIITNQPDRAVAVCSSIRRSTPAVTWSVFVENFFDPGDETGTALTALGEAYPALGKRSLKDFQDWIPVVARYSFEMGRLVTTASAPGSA
jgi:hypothetical protein